MKNTRYLEIFTASWTATFSFTFCNVHFGPLTSVMMSEEATEPGSVAHLTDSGAPDLKTSSSKESKASVIDPQSQLAEFTCCYCSQFSYRKLCKSQTVEESRAAGGHKSYPLTKVHCNIKSSWDCFKNNFKIT